MSDLVPNASLAFPISSTRCNIPKLKRIEDDPLFDSCDVPEPELMPINCQNVDQLLNFGPLPGADGADGACPYFSIATNTQTLPANSNIQPRVTVSFVQTPPNYENYEAGSDCPDKQLDLDQCEYQLEFLFELPAPRPCPELEFTSTLIRERDPNAPAFVAVTVEQNEADDGTCQYIPSFIVNLPCSGLSLGFVASYSQDAPGLIAAVNEIPVELDNSNICSYEYELSLNIPCPIMKMSAQVTRGAALVDLRYWPGTLTGRSSASSPDRPCFGLNRNPFSLNSSSSCEYGYEFRFDIPCPSIAIQAKSNNGCVLVSKRSNVSRGNPVGTVLTPKQLALEISQGFRSPNGLCNSSRSRRFNQSYCEYVYEFDFKTPCPTIDISANVKTIETQDFAQNFTLEIEKVQKGKVNLSKPTDDPTVCTEDEIDPCDGSEKGGVRQYEYVDLEGNVQNLDGLPGYSVCDHQENELNCESSFVLNLQVPKFCPKVEILPVIHRNVAEEENSIPELTFKVVPGNESKCITQFQPVFNNYAPSPPLRVRTGKLVGGPNAYLSCSQPPNERPMVQLSKPLTVPLKKAAQPPIPPDPLPGFGFNTGQALTKTMTIVPVEPPENGMIYGSDNFRFGYDTETEKWSVLSAPTTTFKGKIVEMPEIDPEVVINDSPQMATVLMDDANIRLKFRLHQNMPKSKIDDEVTVNAVKGCQWQQIPAVIRLLITGVYEDGKIDGIPVTTPHGEPGENCIASAMFNGVEYVVIAADCECEGE